ncbi:EpsG family protein [Morganella morganii]|uniref:EpsG family protein n=2 Tax=Morganella morganii TaxID=582 RepID=UPI003D353438|nr:EpsG family protein [Morganella morganii]
MLIYNFYLFTTILLSFIDFFLSKKIRQLLLIIILPSIIIFLGFRYKIGVDWLFYYTSYIDSIYNTSIEFGYNALSQISNYLGINYYTFQFIITTLSILSLLVFFKLFSPTPIFCLAIFILNSFIFNVEAIRQIISLSICTISLIYLSKNRIYTSLILVMLSSTIHVSALVYLTCIIFYLSNYIRNVTFIFSLIFLIISFFGYSILEFPIYILNEFIDNPFIKKIHWYTLNKSSIITYSLFMKLTVILAYYYLFICNRNKSQNSNIIFSCLTAMLLSISLVGIYGTIISRIEIYFLPSLFCSISLILFSINNIRLKIISIAICLFYFSISYVRVTSIDYFKEQYIPYENHLFIDNQLRIMHDINREQSVNNFWAGKNGS